MAHTPDDSGRGDGNSSGGPRLDRRALMTAALAAAAAVAVAPGGASAQVSQAVARAATKKAAEPKAAAGRAFFTAREFETLDEIAEMIIPADEVSVGARGTGVAAYLDKRIGESRDPNWRQSWRDDLAEIDRLSNGMFGKRFVQASPEQRTKLLVSISRNEKNPQEAGEYAFGTIKWSVADAFYRTKAGIHDDLKYQGNVLQAEFAGTDVSRR